MQPLRAWCCGCTLDTGGKVTLVIHTAVSVFYMATTFCNIVLDLKTLGWRIQPATQSFNCFFAIAGIPFIISGFSGVRYRIEPHLRVYLFFLVFTFLLDSVFVAFSLFQQSCGSMPNVMKAGGGAFACGVLQVGMVTFVVLLLGIQIYSAFAIWSLCEEIRTGGTSQAFGNLMEATFGGDSYRTAGGSFVHFKTAGLFGTGPGSMGKMARPSTYGSLCAGPVAGSERIFDGAHHETQFPPGRPAQFPRDCQ